MPLLYTPDLCTLDYVRTHRGLETAETDDDALLKQFVREASTEFMEAIARIPMPFKATWAADYSDPYYLELDDDLLVLTTFTNGDGEAITPASFALRPANTYPKRELILKVASGSTLVYESDIEETFSLSVIGGYVPHYPTCWQDSLVDVPVGGMTASSTTLTLATTAAFEVLQYCKIGDEIIQITAKTATVLTHTRGELGTTATIHLAEVGIYQFRQLPDIAGAVREIAVYKFLHKDAIGGGVRVIAQGSVTVGDLNPSVQETVTRHWRNPGVGAP